MGTKSKLDYETITFIDLKTVKATISVEGNVMLLPVNIESYNPENNTPSTILGVLF
jgi:hypothetical protein